MKPYYFRCFTLLSGNGFPYYFPEAFPFMPPFVVKADEYEEEKPASQKKEPEAKGKEPEAERKEPEANP